MHINVHCLKEVLRFYIQLGVENGAKCGMPTVQKGFYWVLPVVEEEQNVTFYENYVCYPFTYLGPKEMGRKCVCILFSYKQKLT